ncbi:MAG: hypothetical protein LBJ38_01750 [Oscillospiraceae bacterium]|nr:hypothetical protein [Oscillospiraceae bacterium]
MNLTDLLAKLVATAKREMAQAKDISAALNQGDLDSVSGLLDQRDEVFEQMNVINEQVLASDQFDRLQEILKMSSRKNLPLAEQRLAQLVDEFDAVVDQILVLDEQIDAGFENAEAVANKELDDINLRQDKLSQTAKFVKLGVSEQTSMGWEIES